MEMMTVVVDIWPIDSLHWISVVSFLASPCTRYGEWPDGILALIVAVKTVLLPLSLLCFVVL